MTSVAEHNDQAWRDLKNKLEEERRFDCVFRFRKTEIII